ncbi:MAG TPA: PspC domain-containing protein [Desulfotomaculum sp.]|nr:MAG: phage-shock protein [Peptococcaceae bacterium BRH_c8a]KJS71273.1 MAG: phage-shock protein [Desulfotomaculum sp. BICA1-6]HBX22552.1 PspC domain-containing protein [Desulfotomaculum sp.]
MAKQVKKLCRSSRNRMIAGICGGVAEYFDVDPTVVRIGYVIISVFSVAFPGILVYLIAWLLMPQDF